MKTKIRAHGLNHDKAGHSCSEHRRRKRVDGGDPPTFSSNFYVKQERITNVSSRRVK